MLPTGREFVWLLVGVGIAMFVVPFVRGKLAGGSSNG